MKKYTLEILEKHCGTVEVNAETAQEAVAMAQDEINNGMVSWKNIELASVTVKSDENSCSTTGNIMQNVADSAPIAMTICRTLTISMAGSPIKVDININLTSEELKSALDIQKRLYTLDDVENQLSSVLENDEFSNIEYDVIVNNTRLMGKICDRFKNNQNSNLSYWDNIDDAIKYVLRKN